MSRRVFNLGLQPRRALIRRELTLAALLLQGCPGLAQTAEQVDIKTVGPASAAVKNLIKPAGARSASSAAAAVRNADIGQLFDSLKAAAGEVKITNEKNGGIKIRGPKINIDIGPGKSGLHITSQDLNINADDQRGPSVKMPPSKIDNPPDRVVRQVSYPKIQPAKVVVDEPGMPIP